MPNMPYLYAMEFIDVLKKKHVAKSYKEMVKRSVTSGVLCYTIQIMIIYRVLCCHTGCICGGL